MDMMDWILVISINYKKSFNLITIHNNFFCEAINLFFFNFLHNESSFLAKL